uniref:C3H1-type domain-containing protein n=1 Tax=Pyrodinium bahamense TaxID=73915 RepID=A0A7S0B452_9DINO|mmetsp:Transcript_48479/g.134807  ORF Transcript_48479/g.134807 Transcript_48479/m.134807 type:complete len:252 (+) Transcript_48479:1-756(+)
MTSALPPAAAMVVAQPDGQVVAAASPGAAAQLDGGQGTAQLAANQAYTQFYALAQLAEESAQMNASAAAFCASPTADPLQIAMVSEAAQQAAQRAAWASSSMGVLEGQQADGMPEGITVEWLATMKQIARQAADAADQAAQSCKSRAEAVGGTNLQAMIGPRKSKVPCKNHLAGHCMKGMGCEFSHDPADLQARPLMLKSMKPCMFFAKGHCMRGPACPFAHGDEERAEIEKYVDQLKKEKKQLGGSFRRM